MRFAHIVIGCTLVVMAGCQSMRSGDAMPTVTRTGDVKDIVIREAVSPVTLTANPGDEIRWINKRQGNVRVVLLDPVLDMLSCQRNFGGFMGMNAQRNQYTANLSSNDSASLCFRNASTVRYVVRADSNLPSGEENIAGSITVGGTSDRAAGTQPTNRPEQSRMRESAHADQEQGSEPYQNR